MRFNFRKISAALASVSMVGMSAGIAAAAAYPSPYIVGGSVGAGGVGVVYGADATLDVAQVLTISQDLQSRVTTDDGATGGTVTGGDSVMIELGSDKFNLGENFTDFFTSINEDQLSLVLAEGEYANDDGTLFEYDQTITFGQNLILKHFSDKDLDSNEVPVIGLDLNSNTFVFNYTLDFIDDVTSDDSSTTGGDFLLLETTDLPMLGRTYYVLDAQNQSASVKLTLLDAANSAVFASGESGTVAGHEVTVSTISSTKAELIVDGVSTGFLEEGKTKRLVDGTYIAVKDIVFIGDQNVANNKVDFSIGTGRLTLENAQDIELNEDTIEGVTAYITTSTTNLQSITIRWALEDEAFVAPGSELVLPGFEAVKFAMGGFNVANEEVTRIDSSSGNLQLVTEVKDGPVTIDLLESNSGTFTVIGEDSSRQLFTKTSAFDGTSVNALLNESLHETIVASWFSNSESESYVLSLVSVNNDSDKTKVVLRNEADGSEISLREAGSSPKTMGRINVQLTAETDANTKELANLTFSTSSGTVSLNKLFTKEGLRVKLPVNNVTASSGLNGEANFTGGVASWVLNFTEEDEDEDVAAGTSFAFNITTDSDNDVGIGTFMSTALLSSDQLWDVERGADDQVGYIESALASKIFIDDQGSGNPDEGEVTYHGEEAFGDVFVAETSAVVQAGSGGTVGQLGSISVTDAELDSVSDRNLIVVGGSCVNSAAASLVGGAYCGSQWTDATGAGSGQFVIQSFANPWSSGKIALLVAGYEAADTKNAATYLVNQEPDTALGKKYQGSEATSATMVTA
jgi:hypothetical protein